MKKGDFMNDSTLSFESREYGYAQFLKGNEEKVHPG